jgi:hypothetical protein
MRGLQWGDIADGIITVQHNYIDEEGVKQPKYNSTRKVPITATKAIIPTIFARFFIKNSFTIFYGTYIP